MNLTITVSGDDPGDVQAVLHGEETDDCPEISVRWVAVHHHHPLRRLSLHLDVENVTLPEGDPLPPCELCMIPLEEEENGNGGDP